MSGTESSSRELSNRQIGEVLGISAGTVKAHVAAQHEILDVSNRTEVTLDAHSQ